MYVSGNDKFIIASFSNSNVDDLLVADKSWIGSCQSNVYTGDLFCRTTI